MSCDFEKMNQTISENLVYSKILDGLNANIYVTDIDTEKILYMNEAMKRDFNISHPEGEICWKVLQQGRGQRCEFCPVTRLKQQSGKEFVYNWDEHNTLTQRFYRNYDRFITWVDERTVHLQQSVDVTELKSANTDELTQFYTRKFGKALLKETLRRAQAEAFAVTVCLYDINQLKQVNDTCGYAEGDHIIMAISDEVRKNLSEPEFAFRLSGDEFVVLFFGTQKETKKRLAQIGDRIKNSGDDYEMSFCFGLAEVIPGRTLTVDEVLFLADRRMYEQKRQYHIEMNGRRLKRSLQKHDDTNFDYDKERLYDAIVQSTDDFLYICNMKTGIFKYTKSMVEEFDLPGEVIENAAAVWGSKIHPEDRAAFLEANQDITDARVSSHCVEYRAVNREGQWIWVRCRGHLEMDENGDPLLFAGFITKLGKKNQFDGLTGLFNKLEFQGQIERLLDSWQSFSVMLLGIDDIKHINDLYDRAFGDEVIRITSQRLQSLLPEGAQAYRLDGDVFGILVCGADKADMEGIYRAIYHSFENQQICDGKKYYCTLSGGCVFCPEDAATYEGVMKYAGYCLEYSKNHGKKHCTYFSGEIMDQRSRSLELVEALRESVENNFEGFRLLYQPLVNAETGKLMGVEALARWSGEKFGQVSPLEFIPLLESTGMIVDVGKWILRTAVSACKKWVAFDPDFVIDVNLSYVQIHDSDFFNYLRSVMMEEDFSSKNLVLELTESQFVKENERVRWIFEKIRDMGIRIAMDDFGTGYSSLGILKESPTDVVKIDKTFIRDINSSNFDATFIRFVVELCHTVGIQVCLEGVETKETYEIVRSMGLDMIQGYLFDRPLEECVFTDKYFAG